MQSLLPESSSLPHRNSTVKPRLLPLHFAIAKVRVHAAVNTTRYRSPKIGCRDDFFHKMLFADRERPH